MVKHGRGGLRQYPGSGIYWQWRERRGLPWSLQQPGAGPESVHA
jgi:hypothetical protein